MHVKHFDDDALITILYMDDLIITNTQLTLIHEMEDNLNSEFEMIDLGLLHYFLDLHIWHMVDCLLISNPKYVTYLLA